MTPTFASFFTAVEGIVNIECQSLCLFVGIGSSPPSQANVAPQTTPKEPSGGGGDTLDGRRGFGDPIPTKGQTLWYSIYTTV